MSDIRFDVTCIGNAIVDVIASADDGFLTQNEIVKGAMNLVDETRSHDLYGKMPAGVEQSGGSAGNTAAGIASLGGKAAYIGKVRDDQLGEIFAHDMRATGVHFDTPASTDGPTTARCLIIVTEDAQRSMNTYLGACVELTPEDIDADVVAASQVTYMEGYLWDPADAKKAFLKAAEIAHANGRQVAITLSDSFCVDRYRSEFQALLTDGVVDLMFANEHELKALYETSDLDSAVNAARDSGALTALTLGENGAMAISREETVKVPAQTVDNVVDLTGAGDLFASGFLFGLARDYKLAEATELGCLCAASVISHVGARPERALKNIAAQSGFEI